MSSMSTYMVNPNISPYDLSLMDTSTGNNMGLRSGLTQATGITTGANDQFLDSVNFQLNAAKSIAGGAGQSSAAQQPQQSQQPQPTSSDKMDQIIQLLKQILTSLTGGGDSASQAAGTSSTSAASPAASINSKSSPPSVMSNLPSNAFGTDDSKKKSGSSSDKATSANKAGTTFLL